ncbi:uncharacterized protein FOMMEDRAFT_168998 [Fomitiporia mediterranea MF3/22]|uniref:uncharacterized protein n=1 Tax=Fomitiporia mediterranea (strain MF3/22) TaxID=694068 RepID=UPI0004407BCE|nr:uncharacterized protein FOMMEDRAFT_168998 [Fomitiporia mediterranea MF3/22]EJD00735.1 hypothetical protein FOMMEDRAFT_168998 [Fomitiporia mediterranea MF3/22]
MGQSSSIPNETAQLVFTSTSLQDNAVQCEQLGLLYKISTSSGFAHRTTTFERWDARLQRGVPIAEWERKSFRKDKIRMYPGSPMDREPVPVKEFMQRSGWGSMKRTFIANNGRQYVWKASTGNGMKLYRTDNKDVPLASFADAHHVFNRRPQHIKLAPGSEEIIDFILVTCVIVEAEVRANRSSSAAANNAAASSASAAAGREVCST